MYGQRKSGKNRQACGLREARRQHADGVGRDGFELGLEEPVPGLQLHPAHRVYDPHRIYGPGRRRGLSEVGKLLSAIINM